MLKAYVDGFFNKKNAGWGFLIIDEDDMIILKKGLLIKEECKSRNINTEIHAVLELINYCIKHNIKEITIYHDYLGLGNWITGKWKANNKLAKSYKEFVLNSNIKTKFIWVKGHDNDVYNNYLDYYIKN